MLFDNRRRLRLNDNQSSGEQRPMNRSPISTVRLKESRKRRFSRLRLMR